MQVEDFIKLIYQSEFGCRHLKQASDLNYLQQESEQATKKGEDLFEEISPVFCRVNLSACVEQDVKMMTLAKVIEKSIDDTGSNEGLLQKCQVLSELIETKALNLPLYKSKKLIGEYLENIRPIHHSASYRLNYKPYYRVVKTEYAEMLPILSKIDNTLSCNFKCIVGVENHNVELGEKLKTFYPQAFVINTEDFVSKDENASALAEILEKFFHNESFELFKQNGDSEILKPCDLLILEGASAHDSALEKYYTIKVKAIGSKLKIID